MKMSHRVTLLSQILKIQAKVCCLPFSKIDKTWHKTDEEYLHIRDCFITEHYFVKIYLKYGYKQQGN